MSSHQSELEQTGANVTVHVAGPEASHTELNEIVADCCERMRYNNAVNFVFDLKNVEFLASACIGSLVELLREVEPMRGRIALRTAKKTCRSYSKSPSWTTCSTSLTTSTKRSNRLRNRTRGSKADRFEVAPFLHHLPTYENA